MSPLQLLKAAALRPALGRLLGSAATGALLIGSMVTACVAPVTRYRNVDALPAPPDSADVAYNAGRYDAQQFRGIPVTTFTTAASFLGAFALMRSTDEPLVPTITVSSGTTLAAIWSFREMQKPLPEPPQMIRARPWLQNPKLWASYVDGYQSRVEEFRKLEFQRARQTAMVSTVTSFLLYYALRPRRSRLPRLVAID